MSTYCNYWNKVSLVKSKIKKTKKIDSIGIGLASPEEIRRWGERRLPNGTFIGKVDKDHTVDYESLKPIEGGLFCERIFGPVEDFYCSCERKGEKNEKFCPNCEVEFTKSRVRRIRMGYIPLAVPVVHVWYLRGRPSYIANLVGKSRNSIDRLAYGEALSESFIGSSSLESIYKKTENLRNFFPKGNNPYSSASPHANSLEYPERVKGYAPQLCSNKTTPPLSYARQVSVPASDARQALSGLAQLSLAKSFKHSFYPPLGVKEQKEQRSKSRFFKGPMLSYSLPLITGRGSVWDRVKLCSPSSAKQRSWNMGKGCDAEDLITSNPLICKERREIFGSEALHFTASQAWKGLPCVTGWEQKYFKFHILPLFSTFVYKEWSHRFSFLEYFIWSARNNDLLLPFYAYQNSRSKIKVANICESIRKSSINLIKNKFFLRFSNNGKTSTFSLNASSPYSRFAKEPDELFTNEALHFTHANSLPRFASTTECSSATAKQHPLASFHPLAKREYELALHSWQKDISYLKCEAKKRLTYPFNASLVELRSKRLTPTLRYPEGHTPLPFRGILGHTPLGLAEQKEQKKQELRYPHPRFAKDLGFFSRVKNYNKKILVKEIAELYPSGVRSLPFLLEEQKAQPRFLQLRNKQGILRFIKVDKDIGFLFHSKLNPSQHYKPSRAPTSPRLISPLRGKSITSEACTASQARTGSTLLTSKALKGSYLATPTEQQSVGAGGLYSKPSPYRVQLRYPSNTSLVTRGKEVCYAFNSTQQNTESTLLNKIDTQQFPRLTELLNFTGGAALRNLLSRFDLIVLSKFLRHELKNLELKVNSLLALKMLTYSQGLLLGKLAKRRSKQIRRLKLLELFQSQKSNPEWMILSVIPVLPPDLRPILRVNDDFLVASDLNRLYQTVLRRNNTIHERLDDPLPCPESGLFRQRSLQKAVDGLLENGKGGGTPLCASKRRPLVSLSHVLKGKKGLFRQHLLGKRVDYSGRSVIVVGPRLQLHECGLPKEMAIELFQPFLLHRLKVKGLATSNTTARRMIQQGNPVIWHILKQLVYEHPVLLNRAPTLHRLGIQAFQPRLVSGRAILLHPLVCNGFNADFDGDQMAVHVPLSFQARAEAWKIMWSKNNFLSPATGQPILVPSQDMVLGCYYLSVSVPRILNVNVSAVSQEQDTLIFTNKETNANRLAELHPLASLHPERACEAENNPSQLRKASAVLAKRERVCATGYRFASEMNAGFAKLEGYGFAKQNGYSDALLTHEMPSKETGVAQFLLRKPLAKSGHMPEAHFTPLGHTPLGHTPLGHTPLGVKEQKEQKSTKFPVKQSIFLNKNKGQYFSNLQDSLLAYFQGRLQTHTPFWVRIDPVSFKVTSNQKQLAQLHPLASFHPERTCFASLAGSNHNVQLVNKPNIDTLKLQDNGTFLQPLYGSSREMCKTLFLNKNTNNFHIRVEANENLESPLELRLSVNGNLANILTMFQNHYNYNATWVKQCKEESIKYMRTTAGRVVINEAVFKNF